MTYEQTEHDGDQFVLHALEKDKEVGSLRYARTDVVAIIGLEVSKKSRRQGVARGLLKELRERNPDAELAAPNLMTDEAKDLVKGVWLDHFEELPKDGHSYLPSKDVA